MHDADPTPVPPVVAPPVAPASPVVHRRRPPAADPWRGFLAWPGAASLTTLLSAACLLAGVWGVLAEGLGDPGHVGDRWSVLATLAGYLGCLLAGTWAMCRARAGHPDAVASAVVAALLAVAAGVVLDLLAPDATWLAAVAAGAAWCGLLALWWGWNRISGGAGSAAAAPIALLALWALAWPVVLGWRTAGAVAPPGAGTDAVVMPWWTVGWLLLLAPLALLAVAAARGGDPWSGSGTPFLARPAMRWVLALVLAAAAIAALAVQNHVAGLDLAWSDLLPHILLLVVAGNELRARAVGNGLVRDALAVAAVPWLGAAIALAGGSPDASQVRGEGWAPLTAALAASPVLALAAGLCAGLAWWRRRSAGLLLGVGLSACAAVVLADPAHPHLAEVVAIALGVVAVAALAHRRLGVVAAATILAAASLAAGDLVQGWLLHVPPFLRAVVAAGCMVVLWAGLVPELIGRSAAQAAGWMLGSIVAAAVGWLCHGDHPWDRAAALVAVGVGVQAGLVLWCAWRRRDASIAAAMAPAATVALWPALVWLIPRNRAWLGVWAAFALLAGAVVLAVRRVRRA